MLSTFLAGWNIHIPDKSGLPLDILGSGLPEGGRAVPGGEDCAISFTEGAPPGACANAIPQAAQAISSLCVMNHLRRSALLDRLNQRPHLLLGSIRKYK